jgi:hypothetical protein
MVATRAMAVVVIMLLAFPAFGDVNVVGNVTGSQSATVRGTGLVPGSTIFDGDTIEVGARGSARIAFAGGSQVQVSENSQVRLGRSGGKIQLTIDRGAAAFRTGQDSPVEALLADATIRAANGQPAIGIIHVRSPQSAIIAADKGKLEILTAHDSGTLTLREGEAAEFRLSSPESRDPGGPPVAGTNSWTVGKVVVVSVILAGAVTAIALALANSEPTQNNPCLEVSPFRCP